MPALITKLSMNPRIKFHFLCLLLIVPACGRDGFDASGDAGNDASVSAELFGQSDGASGVALSLAVADSFFAFDPTLVPADDAATNLTHVSDHVAEVFPGCPTPTVESGTLTLDFGDSTACTGTNGMSITGSVSIALTKEGSTLTAVTTYTNMTVNGKSLDGSLTFVTTTGSGFTVSGSVVSGDKTLTFSSLNVTGSPSSMTVTGGVAVVQGGATTQLDFQSVTYTTGACYPNGGSVVLTRGALEETITFSSTTPSTGEVSVEVARRTSTRTLPAYGTCPHA